MYTLKICKIGDSLGVTLPNEILQKLKVNEGDSLFVSETADAIQLTSYEPEFREAMVAYRKVSNKYRNALRELAK